MKIYQTEIKLAAYPRGYHLITSAIEENLPEIKSMKMGLLNVFIGHTSASLTINEAADPSVRQDLEEFMDRTVKEDEPYYRHTAEGSDDMPAHIKSSLLDSSINIPVTNGRLNLGTWQGVYLCEHRNHGGSRKLLLTLQGE
jgi:secondary thiamine-phosphate synthase enzyme